MGLGIALYSLHVESKLVDLPGYTPACDISAWAMSCSKVFTSKYANPLSNFGIVKRGSTMDFSLGQLAIVYFSLMIAFPTLKQRFPLSGVIFRVLSHLSIGFNAYLAYVLKFILGEMCIVCVSNYLVNLALWLTIARISRETVHVRRAKKEE